MSEETNYSIEDEARKIIESAESPAEVAEVATVTSLGKAKQFTQVEESPLAGDIGWKNIPIENLPSQGLFYQDPEITIRAASVSEIRHWSTIDENDALGIDDMLNFVIEKCCRIRIAGRPATYREMKEIDRFYLIFAIRDYTFKNGENKLYTTVEVEDGSEQKVEITKDVLNYFNPDEKLMRYYNAEKKCYIFTMKSGETIELHFPSLGVMSFIKTYAKNKTQRGQQFDKAFLRYAPFLIADYKGFSDRDYDKLLQESYSWSIQKISLMDQITTMLANSINPQVRYFKSSGEEGTVPLSFPGGVKSLFLIPDIFAELV